MVSTLCPLEDMYVLLYTVILGKIMNFNEDLFKRLWKDLCTLSQDIFLLLLKIPGYKENCINLDIINNVLLCDMISGTDVPEEPTKSLRPEG